MRLTFALFLLSSAALAGTPNKRILLSAFEPFGGRRENSSQVITEAFAAEWNANPSRAADVRVVVVPVVYDVAPQRLLQAMDDYHPDIVVSTGEAGEASYLLEERARNRDDSPYADNAGNARMGEIIVKGAPEYYATRLPTKNIDARLKAQKLPSRRSQSAGSYLCNHIFFHLMNIVNTDVNYKQVLAGFVHVPAYDIATDPTYPQEGSRVLRTVVESMLSTIALE
ncbi:MAG: hypothetical protein JST16_00425 [Bdellovibrionales bacterium]|nr:hypothetical protein [Bdellovibrionales bacterium]